jgi:hypothetical protein|tara:strand:+ start:37 stop:504 length:468 start_codon:yes stop_codon:yes gene_type:complete
MSFVGNIFSGFGAGQIGKYNQALYYQQAALNRRKTEVARKVYDTLDRPRLVQKFEKDYDYLFVNLLKSGAEVREGESPYLALLDTRINQATDLAIEDYNATTAYYDGMNQSLLLESKGIGEMYKGQLTKRAQYMKAASTIGENLYTSGGTSILAS